MWLEFGQSAAQVCKRLIYMIKNEELESTQIWHTRYLFPKTVEGIFWYSFLVSPNWVLIAQQKHQFKSRRNKKLVCPSFFVAFSPKKKSGFYAHRFVGPGFSEVSFYYFLDLCTSPFICSLVGSRSVFHLPPFFPPLFFAHEHRVVHEHTGIPTQSRKSWWMFFRHTV